MTDMLNAALEYAAHNLPVFPCKRTDKRPLIKGGFHSATADPDQIRAWWKQWPDAMIGMPTGEPSGVDVADLDVKKGKNGFAAIPNWQNLSPVIVRTPSDPKLHTDGAPSEGGHLWFKSDGTIKGTTDTIALGVDTRGAGGYVIVPPSMNGSSAYRFEKGGLEEIANLPPFPADLAARCKKSPTRRPPEEPSAEPRAEAKPQTDDYVLIAALTILPNKDLDHDNYKTVMLAVSHRTKGSAAGCKLFVDLFSKKSKKHDDAFSLEAWAGTRTCPPDKMDDDAILHIVDKAVPGWRWRIPLYAQGSGGYSSADELLSAFLDGALRSGVDGSKIITACLDEAYSGSGIFEQVRENGGEEYVKKQVAHALNETPTAGPNKIIRCKKGERHIVTNATQAALVKRGCPVFYRGGHLVEPLWRWEKTSEKDRDELVTMMVKLNKPRLSYMTGKHAATFQKYNVNRKQWEAIDPPDDVIEQLLELKHWAFPTIRGIINSPTMRSDGGLLTKPGYDPATQLWYKSAGDIDLATIPERPSKEDAQRALQLLTDLLAGFPFKDDVSKTVAIAGLMTPILRGAFDFAPMFLVLAPESGTGKSYYVLTVGTLATGRPPLSITLSERVEERDKQLSAAVFEAIPILHLNNLNFDLESATLNTMITDGTIGVRPFGRNDTLVPCDCRGTTVFANGNNIRIVGDLVRRTLNARLDAKSETPETRKFDFDPVEYIKADRGKYLAAVFTIVRAYMAADKVEATPLGGFEGWSRMVQHPLMWLGLPDPLRSMEDNRAMDPSRAAFHQRIEGLTKAFGIGHQFTSADVFAKAMQTSADSHGQVSAPHPALRDGFARGDGKPFSPKSIGNLLMKDLERVSEKRWIERVAVDHHSSSQFKICCVQEAPM